MGKDQELIVAARNGDYQIVDKILTQRAKRSGPLASLRRGAGVNVQDSSGFSPLHHAAVNRHRDIVELLLSHEASTNIVDLQGSSPLHLAAWSGNEEIVWLLLTHGPSTPNVNLMNQSLETALHMAAQFGHVRVVKLLLDHGANPVITNSRQETSLDLAAQYGRLETVQLLVNSHPELLLTYSLPHSRHAFPHTPLHLASRNGHRSVVDVLVNAGFEVNARTAEGTALHEAALCGKVDVVKVLLDAGIDVCVTDSARRTAVDRLSEVGLKTPVAKEIAELIRGALKRTTIQFNRESSGLSSPLGGEPVTPPLPQLLPKDKLPLSQIYDNHSRSDLESSSSGSTNCVKGRHSYSPRQSPKSVNNFTRDKTRRSLDVYLSKGPDFDKSLSGPPKKPPRRNLSASPTHPDFYGAEVSESLIYPSLARNKSLDESVYRDTWRNSVGVCCETTSQSTDSLDTCPTHNNHLPLPYLRAPDRDSLLPGRGDIHRVHKKSKSEHIPSTTTDDVEKRSAAVPSSGHNFVSVARINLRDSKSEQNMSPRKLRLSEAKSEMEFESDASTHASDSSYDAPMGKVRPVPRQKPLVAPKPVILAKPQIPPKPKNITRQGHSYDNVLDEGRTRETVVPRRSTQKSTSMSVLSPTDLDREWEGIATFINSLNVKIDSDGEERRTSPIFLSDLGKWLSSFRMNTYESLLVTNGFDDLAFLGDEILDEASLLEIGMLNAQHRKVLTDECLRLDVRWPRDLSANGVPNSVGKWLQELHLDQYVSTFEKNFYLQPERLLSLWNDELMTVLEIEPLGHRRRILMAVSKVTGNKLQPRQSTRIENEEESDGSLPLREPHDLVSGVSSALKTAWRHTPETLINGSVTYRAIYVGSCSVQEFSTTNSIQRAICEIRAQPLPHLTNSGLYRKSEPKASVHNTPVTLIVSASVISWYNAKSKSLVSEHEVGTIQCTCQASDDLRHLALVTKDPNSTSHSCHVFCLDSVEIATEAILTLGQAFEVAYQLALSVRKDGRESCRRHIRSKSANQLSTNISIPETNSRSYCGENDSFLSAANNKHHQQQQHARSHSVTDLPPILLSIPVSKSTKNSHHMILKDQKLPRAESFSFTTQTAKVHQLFSRAPIVSKEEL